jgi:hypothetical protein
MDGNSAAGRAGHPTRSSAVSAHWPKQKFKPRLDPERGNVLRGNQDARAYCLTGECYRTIDSLPHHSCSRCLSAHQLEIELAHPLSHACLLWRDLWSCGRRVSVVQAQRQIHRVLFAS